jgi:hypothetical protein
VNRPAARVDAWSGAVGYDACRRRTNSDPSAEKTYYELTIALSRKIIKAQTTFAGKGRMTTVSG